MATFFNASERKMCVFCMAHATVAGIGILIEKSFQPGRRKINEQGYEVYSLARIKYMDEYQIDFIEEN